MDARAVLTAMNRSQAIIEFDLAGKILHANENFLKAVGYELSEIVGQHHRLFVEPEEARSAEYAAFWARLAEGQFDQRQYRRIAKGGPGLPEESGPWDTAMPQWEKMLTEEEMWDVVLFLYDFSNQKPRAREEVHH